MKLFKKTILYMLNLLGLKLIRSMEFDRLQKKMIVANSIYKDYLINKKTILTDSEYLQFLELKYGGYVTNVTPTIDSKKVSRLDKGPHTGGDRMNLFFHNYSEKYSQYLESLRHSKKTIHLLEVGILKGTGLAVWDEYFDNKRIYGFDYDLGNFKENKINLLELGAFKKELPTLKFYDQFEDNSEMLKETFGKEKIDVVIDDAYHSDKSVINTFNELQPNLNENFVYFIEDNKTAWKKLRTKYPNFNFDYNGNELTVVTRKS